MKLHLSLIRICLPAAALGLVVLQAGCASLAQVGATVGEAAGVITPQQGQSLIKVGQAADKTFADITPEQEYYIGRAVGATIVSKYQVYDQDRAVEYVNLVGQSLALASTKPETFGGYHFLILDSDEINAFAAPGGFIFVTRGMLAFANPSPDDELASVIGHEIAHIARRHGAKRIERVTLALAAIEAVAQRNQDWETIYQSQTGQITKEVVGELLVRGWGRNQEFDADHYGVLYMKQAGYDPNAAVMLFMRMQNAFPPGASGPAERLLSTHPPFADRIERMETVIQANP